MNVVVLYETKKNRDELKNAIEKRDHEVTLCSSTGDFFEAIYENKADMFVIDMPAWYRGSAIYNYFKVPSKLADTPIVYLNIPEGFSSIEGRDAISGDVSLEKDCSFDEVAAVIG